MSTANRPTIQTSPTRVNPGQTVDVKGEKILHHSRFVRWLRLSLDLESSDPEAVRIAPWAFLKSMIAITWVSVRHPRSTTAIDLATGTVVPEV